MDGRALRQQARQCGPVLAVRDPNRHAVFSTGAGNLCHKNQANLLQVIKTHALAKQLGHTAQAPSDVVVTVGIAQSQVARAQAALALIALGQIGALLGIAHGHIGASVAQLALYVGSGNLAPGRVHQEQLTARYGHANAARFFQRPRSRHIAHACGRLGLAVHHVKVNAAACRELGKFANQGVAELAARLGQGAQRAGIRSKETQPLEHLVGVGHTRQRGRTGLFDERPERFLHDRAVGHQQGGAHLQVAAQHGKTVGVMQRQSGDRAIAGANVQVARNRQGVRQHITPALPNQLGTARAARGAQQQGQVGVRWAETSFTR